MLSRAAAGKVRILCRRFRSGIEILVDDDGPGIRPDALERIFERFHRSDNRLSRSTAGVGLGLYITRSIIAGHGGRIWAESPGPGGGSTFTIVLPVGETA